MAQVLLFTRTTDYRHASIAHAADVVGGLLRGDGHDVRHTEDPTAFRSDALASVALTVWLSTSGDVLDDEGRDALASWLADGGAWAGIHSATFSEPTWPEFERIAGAVFTDHPDVQTATVRVVDAGHPSTAHLPAAWRHTDEWYNFRSHPAADRTVLLTVDEADYDGGSMGEPHPIAWAGPYGRGRTWYTALGHEADAYDDPLLRAHLHGGLRSVLSPEEDA
ncbi:ThuA domain-containing protein [Actinotalea sp. Marseille-Q4924]|uniref:ThuA domain-containing protein n=1 Tax=Actinotalea sp. Marseille-Q4924 TaxID=2866571 RepID=UPI001CE49B9C|nr:ThuA domain-containing protein [Actinotalea sp. Marseille-Q4924]